MRWRLLVTCMLASVALVTPAFGAAQPDPSTFREPFEGSLINPCTGEEVLVSGTIFGRVNTVVDARGVTHYSEHLGILGTGTGSFGNSYRWNRQATTVYSTSAETGGTRVLTATLSDRIIGIGAVPDFRQRVTLHYNIDDEGNLTNVVESFDSTECLG